jgi:hypothetical protein
MDVALAARDFSAWEAYTPQGGFFGFCNPLPPQGSGAPSACRCLETRGTPVRQKYKDFFYFVIYQLELLGFATAVEAATKDNNKMLVLFLQDMTTSTKVFF